MPHGRGRLSCYAVLPSNGEIGDKTDDEFDDEFVSHALVLTTFNSVQLSKPAPPLGVPKESLQPKAGQFSSSTDCLLPKAGQKSLQREVRTQPKAVYGPKPLGVDPEERVKEAGIQMHFGEDGPLDFQYRYGDRDDGTR